MKKILLLATAVAYVQFAAFAINFSGIISSNTTWTKANSPYLITGQVLVDSNVLLSIEPGVEVRMMDNYHFYVDGSIYAVGTTADSIVFTSASAQPNSWDGISLRPGVHPDSAIFKYIVYKHAHNLGGDKRMVVTNSYLNALVRSTTLMAKNNFVYGGNIWSNPVNGVSEISNNEVVASSGLAIYCNAFGPNSALIKNNYVHDCPVGLVIEGENMTAERNALAHNSVGLETRNTNPGFIRNNIIAYNKTGIDLKSGGQFTGNTITHNETGVHLSGGPGSGLQFYNNCIDSNTDFNITTRSEDTYIQNNYWGTTDSALILHSIKDFYTDFSLGIAHYMPVLQQPDSNCTDVSQYAPTAVPEIPAPTALGIYPNPFSSSFNINAGMQVVRQVTVYSITGAALVTMQPATHNATIDMGGYPAGMYIYKAVLADGSQYAGRLQKE